MTDKDSRRVEEEKATLKAIFTYRSLQHDIELVLEDTERAMFADANRRGQPLYGIASKFVLDCYYERGALEPLVKAYSGQPYRVASRFDRLLRHLTDAQRVDLIERLWASIARVTRAEFLYHRPRRDYGDAAGAQEFKNYALEAYARGIECLTKLCRPHVADGLTRERTALLEERFRSLSPPSDLRRVDASVFWELIST